MMKSWSSWLLLLCALSAQANEFPAELRVGLSQNAAPQKQGNTIHFEAELFRQLLSELGYKAEFVAAPHARLTRMLQNKELDMAARQGGEPVAGLFYSQPYLEFHNLVFALSDFPDQLHSVQDMSRYSVASFQNATKILGAEFTQAMKKSPSFREVVDHNQAVEMLQKQRTQLLVLDKVTFYRRWSEKSLPAHKVRSFDLFPKAQHRIGFTDLKLQQQVSQLLQKWQDSGRVAQLQKQTRQLNQSLN
ncbi:substrate-binding periplasmic protein [Rheinheimera sp.]|jgi:polar amino acid transport system substrate-binding protein|uniref:substrate-binding periplasmic protein n=2 Tax=Rheinheimera TaxID=67575 RepID=UPI002B4A7C0A|nr:transporter substrate-binding domain-containing protein [Rheinheimera sp.]HJS14367.1 transporter substrate-binding domain-containing protein [Rheinheimera sp.]